MSTPVEPDAPAVVRLAGELDVADLTWADWLDETVSGGARHVVVDLLNVTFADSSVLRTLVVAHRRLTERGGWLRVVYTHHVLHRVIEICGLTGVLAQYTTVAAAARGTPTRHSHGSDPDDASAVRRCSSDGGPR